jgi:hypothetical protein
MASIHGFNDGSRDFRQMYRNMFPTCQNIQKWNGGIFRVVKSKEHIFDADTLMDIIYNNYPKLCELIVRSNTANYFALGGFTRIIIFADYSDELMRSDTMTIASFVKKNILKTRYSMDQILCNSNFMVPTINDTEYRRIQKDGDGYLFVDGMQVVGCGTVKNSEIWIINGVGC